MQSLCCTTPLTLVDCSSVPVLTEPSLHAFRHTGAACKLDQVSNPPQVANDLLSDSPLTFTLPWSSHKPMSEFGQVLREDDHNLMSPPVMPEMLLI